MRRDRQINLIKQAAAVCLLLTCVFGLFGCAAGTPLGNLLNPTSTDQQRIDGARQTYNIAMTVLIAAKEDGKIGTKDWHNVVVASNTFVATVDELAKVVAAGGKLADQQTQWDALTVALNQIVSAKGSVLHASPGNSNGPATAPATAPSSRGEADRRTRTAIS